MILTVPEALMDAISRCAEQESIIFGRNVSVGEIIMRAMIDRVGVTFGTKYAKDFYRRFFNGIVALEPAPKDLPEVKTIPFGYAEADS